MIATLLAVVGTLAGAGLTGWMQLRAAAAARSADAATEQTAARRAAAVDLLAVVEDHRRAMWMREEARLAGADADRVRELRAASHQTRAAIDRPHASVVLLAPELRHAADTLVSSAYALRNASTTDELAAARDAAVTARQTYITAAAVALR